MRLLIDGNVVLDVLQSREPHVAESSKVWKLCETEQAEGYISTLTFANLVYVMRKELDPEKIEDVLKKLSLRTNYMTWIDDEELNNDEV
jgi:predicted nucleic acid-binding protein